MGKWERLSVEKSVAPVAVVTEHGLENASPSPFRGLPRISEIIRISFVLIHYSVKEQRL
jgi:hypothetical protein